MHVAVTYTCIKKLQKLLKRVPDGTLEIKLEILRNCMTNTR